MKTVKVSDLIKGQFFYEGDRNRYFCRLSFSSANNAYFAIELLTNRLVLFDGNELVKVADLDV